MMRRRAGPGVPGAGGSGAAAAGVPDRGAPGRRGLRLRPDRRVHPDPAHHQPPPQSPARGRDHRQRAPRHLGLLPAHPRGARAPGLAAHPSGQLATAARLFARGPDARMPCLVRRSTRRTCAGRQRGVTAALRRLLLCWRRVQCGFDRIPALAAVLAPEARAVFQDGIDFPPLAVGGALDPELVLPGVAAGRVALVDRGEPASASRVCSASTVSVSATSMPRWFRLPPWPGFSIRISLSGGSAMAKLA